MLRRSLAAVFALLLFMPLISCTAPGGTPAPVGTIVATIAPSSAAGPSSGGGTTLTIACVDETQQLQYAVTEFTKAYPDVNVQVHDFHQQIVGMKSSGQADFAAIIQQLNAEMMSGAGPDIIDTDGLPYYRYADKGLLEDIGALMSGDKSFDRSRYLGNILGACGSNGRLYAVPSSFFFNVLCCKAEYSPGAGNVTVQQFLQKAQALPQGVFAFAKNDPAHLFMDYMQDSYSAFVNYGARVCSFDSPAFIGTLEAFKTLFDVKISNEDVHDRMGELGQLMEGTLAYSVQQIDSLMIVATAKAVLGDTATFTNVPVVGDGSAYPFEARDMLAVNAGSKNKELAWGFVKTMLSQDVQTNGAIDGFPVLKPACDSRIDSLAGLQYILDASGASHQNRAAGGGNPGVLQLGGASVELKPLNASDLAWLRDRIGKLNKLSAYDDAIGAILQDELPAFFAGQKSAGDTAASIQNRVNLVLNE